MFDPHRTGAWSEHKQSQKEVPFTLVVQHTIYYNSRIICVLKNTAIVRTVNINRVKRFCVVCHNCNASQPVAARVALRTALKLGIKFRTDFREKSCLCQGQI